jgi:hypothetical protein
MLTLRPSAERGHFDFGWLDTRHTFSFGDYDDPKWRGFRTLRVINEDVVQPGRGFDTHPHRDMEILTFVLSGALRHEDSMGNGSVIRPGDVQRMSAGTGVTHSEWNASETEPVHLLQVWILPERRGLEPGYEQVSLPAESTRGRLRRLASRRPGKDEVTIHQDAAVHAASLGTSERVEHPLAAGRHAWIQVARGKVVANGRTLSAGDGLGISGEPSVEVESPKGAEFLLFDLG